METVGAKFSDQVKLDLEKRRVERNFRRGPYHYMNQFDARARILQK